MRALLLVLALVAAVPAGAMTPDEAYAAIPHRRTTFDARTSKAPPTHVASLERLFSLTDQGVVLRVEGIRAQRNRDGAGVKRVIEGYDALIAKLQAEPLEPAVVPARTLIVDAVRAHRRYLASQPQGGLQFVRSDLSVAPDVREASQRLHSAYSVLLQAFPAEPPRNKAAFYDYLCALDHL
jgi:hypothetical protein